MRYLILTLILFLQIACYTSAQQFPQQKVQRQSLTRVPVKLEVPKDYQKRDLDDETTLYDHKPRVIVVDEKAGKYEFRWIGYDGKEKVIKYQRLGAIDVLVSANSQKMENGKYLYTYTVKNLSSSANNLSGLWVQNYASETTPIELDRENILITKVLNIVRGFTEGRWWSYSILDRYKPVITPGSKIELQLESSAQPGLVACKADGGEFGVKGVGEDMPPELENLMLGTKDLPFGYTIGPIDKLAEMNKSEKAKYVLENLPKFQEAGWMSSGTAQIYESILKREDLAGALKQAKKDLQNEFITSEVFSIIEGLNR